MRKNQHPKRELEICHRIRESRELLDLSQARCAREIGLERSTLTNLELGRTALRCDVALRYCRQFIISEEWLATGQFRAVRAALDRSGITYEATWPSNDPVLVKKIMFRQCVDLLSEPAAWQLPRTELFSAAYDRVLATHYSKLVAVHFARPRLRINDADMPAMAMNLLNAVNERVIEILNYHAMQAGVDPRSLWGVYSKHMLECSDLAFKKLMHLPQWGDAGMALEWLRTVEPERPEPPQGIIGL